jgi:phage-related protein
MKPLKFIGSSEDDLASFPREVKQVSGFQLFRVQAGLMPADWKPMLNVGTGAYEIRVHVLGEWRVIYVAKFANAIYVLHAFKKRRSRRARKISNWQVPATSKLRRMQNETGKIQSDQIIR